MIFAKRELIIAPRIKVNDKRINEFPITLISESISSS